MRILAVDDDPLFLEMLVSYLAQHGFRDVVHASSAAKALAIIDSAEVPFDCFLLDIRMPEVDGVELCSEIRARPVSRGCPVIMLTSLNTRKWMQAAMEAGATDYLTKPLDPVELAARLRSAMLLVEATARDTQSRLALKSMFRMTGERNQFSAGTRITFSEIGPMRDYFQLENRLLKLGEGAFAMTLFSVSLPGFGRLARKAGGSDILGLINSASQTLAHTVPKKGFSFAYVGHGKFICMILVANPIVASLLQQRLNDRIAMCLRDHEVAAFRDSRFEVKALSNRRILDRCEALRLLKREISALGSSEDVILPSIKSTAPRIFRMMEDKS